MSARFVKHICGVLKMKYSNYRKKSGFFAGKGFYVVLAACIVAVGVASWSAMSTISSVDERVNSSKEQPTSSIVDSADAEDVGKTVSDVKNDKASSSQVSSQEEPVSSETSSTETPTEEPMHEVYYTLPVKNCNIGKLFSDTALQYSATHGDRRLHLGVDLLAKEGTDVVAAASGTVQKVTTDSLWGKMVVIDHGSGIVAYYCGIENTTVSEKETVKAGVKIGQVGTVPCECADESHIHIAVTRDGKYISPLDLIGMN